MSNSKKRMVTGSLYKDTRRKKSEKELKQLIANKDYSPEKYCLQDTKIMIKHITINKKYHNEVIASRKQGSKR